MSERCGGKYALGIGILLTSVVTLFTPTIAKVGDWPLLVASRIIVGMGEVPFFEDLHI